MPSPSKYHLGKNGPAPCRASKRACRYAQVEEGVDHGHFTTLEEAEAAYARRMEAEGEGVTRSLKKPRRSEASPQGKEASTPSPKDPSSLAALTSLAQKDPRDCPPKAYEEVGRLLGEDLTARLSFDPYGKEADALTKEERRQLASALQETLQAHGISTGAPFRHSTSGNATVAKALSQAVERLPNSLKEQTSSRGLHLEKVRSNNRHGASGYHMGVGPSRTYDEERFMKWPDNVEEGDLVSRSYDPPEGIYGLRVVRYMGEGRPGRAYWVNSAPSMRPGKKSRMNPYTSKKVQEGEVPLRLASGEVVTLEVEVHERFKVNPHDPRVSTIAAPAYYSSDPEDATGHATLVHEYTHMLEEEVPTFALGQREAFYGEVATGEVLSSGDAGDKGYRYRGGFPTEYMGNENAREVFTVATEGLFVPETEASTFYGSDRHPNADRIRAWTLGLWATAALRADASQEG